MAICGRNPFFSAARPVSVFTRATLHRREIEIAYIASALYAGPEVEHLPTHAISMAQQEEYILRIFHQEMQLFPTPFRFFWRTMQLLW